MNALRPALLLALFLLATGLEIAHGVDRLAQIRGLEEAQRRTRVSNRHHELASLLERRIAGDREHAEHLARSTPLRRLASALEASAVRGEVADFLLPYLASFRGLDAISVVDAAGREVLRCQRVGQGVAMVPERDLVAVQGVAAGLDGTPPGVGRLLGLEADPTRVEVPVEDRQQLCLGAWVAVPDQRCAVVVCTYAERFLDPVRSFSTDEGVDADLRDGHGRSIGHGPSLSSRPARSEPDLVTALASHREWSLVTSLADVSLSSPSQAYRADYARVLVVMVAVGATLVTGAIFVLRSSVAEARRRERQRTETQQRDLEERLRVSERMSSLGLLTAGVAHEINNPLEGIGNYLSLLERIPPSDGRSTGYLRSVRQGFERIREIVRELTSLARPSLDDARVDLAQLLREAIALSGFGTESRGPEIRCIGLEHEVAVRGDAGRLQQILLNILLNARRAAGETGLVSVTVAARADGRVGITVDDDGPGVPPALRERIFEPFFTTGTEGTGLGLSIAYRLVQAHGDVLIVGDSPSGGARFSFSLARAPSRGPFGGSR